MNDPYTTNVNGVAFTVEEYKAFLYNPDNVMKCHDCPENEGFDGGPGANRLPCGQFHCWVKIHCDRA